ncbi:MAG: hypothetical protein JW809_17185, partial [Pirellulales bacterium]|nr:hypothetical protein [Pirellulales bacterium]
MPLSSCADRVPSYRRHKPSGQAVVTLAGRDIYLGKWNTRASRAEYDRLVGEWLAGGRCLPPQQDTTRRGRDFFVVCLKETNLGSLGRADPFLRR